MSVDNTILKSTCVFVCRAVGNRTYGSLYRDQITESLRKAAEHCDCLQSFFIIHSMGGGEVLYKCIVDRVTEWVWLFLTGTGSGVGTRILELLQDHYPEVYRFTTAVFPSADDDVVTSPYNR